MRTGPHLRWVDSQRDATTSRQTRTDGLPFQERTAGGSENPARAPAVPIAMDAAHAPQSPYRAKGRSRPRGRPISFEWQGRCLAAKEKRAPDGGAISDASIASDIGSYKMQTANVIDETAGFPIQSPRFRTSCINGAPHSPRALIP